MIYCAEDDGSIRELIVYALKSNGFDAMGFADGKEFFSRLKEQTPSLILLDIMLPGEDGISILRHLRSNPDTRKVPVIMLTAKSSEFDKVTGLDSGADDYVTKPFGVMELISRVRAVLRRSEQSYDSGELVMDQLHLNPQKHIVTVKGKEVVLTFKEFELLKCLMENKGIVFTRDKLLETVWGYDFEGETRTVDVHVRTLRQKLGECGNLIETVRGVGYRIGGSSQ